MSKDFSSFKLTIDWKSRIYNGQVVRNNISHTLWRKIRLQVLKQNNNTCQICGYSTNEKSELRNLHVHEIEEHHKDEFLVTLKELSLICKDCHSFQHIGRSLGVYDEIGKEKMIQHFMKVNNCTTDDYEDYLNHLKEIKYDDHLIYRRLEFEHDFELDPIMFRIEGEIPYKDKVVHELTEKDMYRYCRDDFDTEQEFIRFMNRGSFEKKRINSIKVYKDRGTWNLECDGKIEKSSMLKKYIVPEAKELKRKNPEATLEID
ncbi:HNH endonuclease [Peribacillus phoenicis]|uniref:HNH endonuclease n=1 Tax=unclassified Peribacillus TaxID=2675266 RepID=UPI0039A07C10